MNCYFDQRLVNKKIVNYYLTKKNFFFFNLSKKFLQLLTDFDVSFNRKFFYSNKIK